MPCSTTKLLKPPKCRTLIGKQTFRREFKLRKKPRAIPVFPLSSPKVYSVKQGESGTRSEAEALLCSLKAQVLPLSASKFEKHQPLSAARIGIVTVEAVSEDPSMWQRPSKMPPGSMTMHGACTSPVTTPLASISTRPFAKITPSKRPEITTRLPSICPSTLAPSPRITVCSEMMLPFTLPSMRNVPVTVSVPSSDTPWSMNPVHSSLAPLLAALGHFHAMSRPPYRDCSTLAAHADKSTQLSERVVE